MGQPRDGDNRACYVLADEDRVVYRRVPYDFKKTIEKMSHIGYIHHMYYFKTLELEESLQ